MAQVWMCETLMGVLSTPMDCVPAYECVIDDHWDEVPSLNAYMEQWVMKPCPSRGAAYFVKDSQGVIGFLTLEQRKLLWKGCPLHGGVNTFPICGGHQLYTYLPSILQYAFANYVVASWACREDDNAKYAYDSFINGMGGTVTLKPGHPGYPSYRQYSFQ